MQNMVVDCWTHTMKLLTVEGVLEGSMTHS